MIQNVRSSVCLISYCIHINYEYHYDADEFWNDSYEIIYITFFLFFTTELKDKIRLCKWYHEDDMPVKLYILLPQCCRFPRSIGKLDKNVKYVGQLDTILGTRSGNLEPQCKALVYRIQDEDGRVSSD